MKVTAHSWVADRLGVRLRSTGPGTDARELLGLALRHNPRRAQLLVSRVLGKHVPTDPRVVRASGLLLGDLVASTLAHRPPVLAAATIELLHAAARGDRAAAAALHTVAVAAARHRPRVDALVLGFAETATALGHCVADALGADYLHSTRRLPPEYAVVGGFREEHSHAGDHLLLPADPGLLRGDRPLVLVDDELSTGRTALNTITALQRVAPRERYVVAALVDVREPAQAADLAAAVTALGAQLDVVALARAGIDLPVDLLERAGALRAAHHRGRPSVEPATGPAQRLDLRALRWPADLPSGARHGWTTADRDRFEGALPGVAAGLGCTGPVGRILVLGTEELMYVPLRIAAVLAGTTGAEVAFSTTTRSPVLVVPETGYAVTSGLEFAAHDDPTDGPGPRFAYNLGGPDDPPWDVLVLVVDAAGDTPVLCVPGGLLSVLTPRARRLVVVVAP